MNQEKSPNTVRNSIPSPTDLTQTAMERTQKATAKTSVITQSLPDREIKGAAHPLPGCG